MTSNERRECRYKRRQEMRKAKRCSDLRTFDNVFSFSNLYRAGVKSCRNVRWKTSTINFETFICQECYRIRKELKTGKRSFKGFHSFTLTERGKTRAIDALPIRDRAAQKCMMQNLLTEAYSKTFIADNSASTKGKGMDYALRRLKLHLQRHYRKYGLRGGIYQYDFKGYFASIPHDGIKARARNRITDNHLYRIFCDWVDDFQLLQTADRTSDIKRGAGLGSEASQIIALDYASPIDHYIKERCGIKGYGRYMDDGYIISQSLKELYEIKAKVYELANSIGLTMSDKKNIITPFAHHGFTFLKMRMMLKHGNIVTSKIDRRSSKAMRRKLLKFRARVNDGSMDAEDVFSSYQSWRAHARRAHSYDTLQTMDAYFTRLFAGELRARTRKFPCTLDAVKLHSGWEYRRRKGRI